MPRQFRGFPRSYVHGLAINAKWGETATYRWGRECRGAQLMTMVVGGQRADFDRAQTTAAVKDLFAKCHEDGGYFPMLRMARDRYYCLPKLYSPPGRTLTFRGRKVIQWAINNYLG